jgi:D-alanyl-D-alanine carboxypeptidase/D-alanyl-D-alanine-endopeptidase (penicillin-binding protein 4)
VSALTVNDNIVVLEVMPGATVGAPVQAVWRDGDDLQPLETEAVTVADGEADLRLERRPGQEGVRLYGWMPVGAASARLRVGLDDPALTAARRFRRLLEARGVTVEGEVRARHRSPTLTDAVAPVSRIDGVEVARLARPPLLATLTRTARFSQNLHAELMLHRLGRLDGTGARADGLARIEAMMATAGLPREAFDLYDGSGLSTYNRVSPRAVTTFLLWTMDQPWGEAWRATLPVGGRNGTLLRRFVGTPLEGKVFAKTGTLNGVNALAGFLTAASGRTLVFAIYANDRPASAGSALEAMDRALLALAAEN